VYYQHMSNEEMARNTHATPAIGEVVHGDGDVCVMTMDGGLDGCGLFSVSLSARQPVDDFWQPGIPTFKAQLQLSWGGNECNVNIM